ncbi:alpha-amylase/4-alpha-glucanotransferase domain-containing protein [Parasphaerochaeta coccoides]|uniref:Glycoside hydrolase family 57 n=1 Tax=Parasphaerochaeta coccoides (strain ATCC BAA-1237 / DSM 17374 / SPN1) TaxID=760011 RepID=F4GJC4_PARC1|nr:alpha-amylase/4-alpha-glucanotransferase domain-containing protein [Parasphaerochaeta coccoides]AEC01764.1 glycoside hydrolase family 57 [Parasphaerochaeta coccoides DSM 17374]
MFIGAYSQIPHGSSPQAFKRVVDCALKPLLTHLYQKPWVRLHLYLSGALLECLDDSYPEINMLIVDLIKKEQLEFLTGGYYQPVLHVLPAKERSLQIEKMTTLLRKRFGKRARVLWCYNQIWNPSLVNTMKMCSLDAVVISPFDALGGKTGTEKPFRMQEMGKFIKVFPSDDGISYAVRQYADGQTDIEMLKRSMKTSLASHPDAFAMINIDQLCQGAAQMVPRDDEHVWNVFETVFSLFPEEVQSDQGKTQLYALVERPEEPLPLGYLPSGWYGRDASIEGVRAFNDLLVQDNTVNYLHARLLTLTEIVRAYRKNRDVRKYVEALLEKASGSAAYIRDSAGGPYTGGLRKYCYRHISAAEQQLMKQPDISFPFQQDVDYDGMDEYLVSGKVISGVLHARGGSLCELIHLPSAWNYADTAGVPAKDSTSAVPGLFQDCLLLNGAEVEKPDAQASKDIIRLANHIYDITVVDKKNTEFLASCTYPLKPAGNVIFIEKRYKFRTNAVIVTIRLKNEGQRQLVFKLGEQVNLTLGQHGGTVPVFSISRESSNIIPSGTMSKNHKSIRILDEENKTTLSLVSDARFSIFHQDFSVPVNTLLGFHEEYQYTELMPVWNVDLPSGAEMTYMLALKIER